MILFHVETLDLDKTEVRSRAWLPACLLRRSRLAARLVAGDIPTDLLSSAKCVVLTEGTSRHALGVARRAADARVPVILDIGDIELLNAAIAEAGREQFLELAALASAITAGTAMLARHIEHVIGVAPVMVVPDPIDIHDSLFAALRLHPGATMRMAAARADRWARDAVARLRRRWRGHAISDAAGKSIVWFGAATQPNREGGVAELLLAASDLVELAEEFPLRLDIVGWSPRAARRSLKHLEIPITFHRYSPQRAREKVRTADLCVLPGGRDPDSLTRSTARARLATALGVPVIAATIDKPLLPAMRAVLADGTKARGRRDRSELRVIQAQEAASAVLEWQRAISASQPSTRQRPGGRIAVRMERKLRVLLLLQQFQDIDLVVPVAEAASVDPDLEVRVAVLSKIAVPASRRLRTICANGGKIEFWHGADLLAGRIAQARFAADVAVTASEGTGFGARFARAFVSASHAAGARVLSLQHGLDNGGLTYGPRVSPSAFRADVILTWGGLHRLAGTASAAISQKSVPVGCPKRVFRRSDFAGFPLAARPFIAVFENLHWRRYDDDYRRRFVLDLVATADSMPEQIFLVKPHMGGQWFIRGGAAAGALPANLIVADPQAVRWRRFTADAVLAHASAVITTPSTIAIDAARYGVPVAVVTYGIEAQNYAPLPRLEQNADWRDFVDEIQRGLYDRRKLDAFFADAAVPGDAVARILTAIRMAGARRSCGEIMAAFDVRPTDLAAS